jgi:hypothetical protein
MATKAEELKDGCLSKVAEDEPVFVLRARDKLAPLAVMDWIARAEMMGVSREKIDGAIDLLHKMWVWRAANGSKLPD